MTKTFSTLASIALIAMSTSAFAGGSTKGTGGYNGVAKTGMASERFGGSTKGTGGLNGVSRTGLSASDTRMSQTSMKVLSVTLPTKPDVAGR